MTFVMPYGTDSDGVLRLSRWDAVRETACLTLQSILSDDQRKGVSAEDILSKHLYAFDGWLLDSTTLSIWGHLGKVTGYTTEELHRALYATIGCKPDHGDVDGCAIAGVAYFEQWSPMKPFALYGDLFPAPNPADTLGPTEEGKQWVWNSEERQWECPIYGDDEEEAASQ